jgi:hypothetical protein
MIHLAGKIGNCRCSKQRDAGLQIRIGAGLFTVGRWNRLSDRILPTEWRTRYTPAGCP